MPTPSGGGGTPIQILPSGLILYTACEYIVLRIRRFQKARVRRLIKLQTNWTPHGALSGGQYDMMMTVLWHTV